MLVCVSPPVEGRGSEDKSVLKFVDEGRCLLSALFEAAQAPLSFLPRERCWLYTMKYVCSFSFILLFQALCFVFQK